MKLPGGTNVATRNRFPPESAHPKLILWLATQIICVKTPYFAMASIGGSRPYFKSFILMTRAQNIVGKLPPNIARRNKGGHQVADAS
ncbi:hypothetical protein TYRP_019915 [Tyrophagus putrescentiae]|nr:hypothetical protein TYRP_019915 [Tyrophagus putrescentiae]